MNPGVLLLVTSDPRTSARPAEAIRLAAGVGTWQKADVTLYLRGPAVLALGEWVDELVDEDNFSRYLPLVAELGRPLYVQRGAAELAGLGETIFTFEAIDDSQLAGLVAQARYVFRF